MDAAKDQLMAGGILLGIIALGALYFLPTIIASFRGHQNINPIGLTNLFFGWTAIGWLIALIWSSSNNVRNDG